VDTSFTEEQQKLRTSLRNYLGKLMTPELRTELARPYSTEGGGELWRQAFKKLGSDGWIGLGWPKEWGGKGLGTIEQYIFVEEVTRSGFPFPYLTTESIGPAIAEFASEEVRTALLPKILAGELVVAIGYTEPNAGSDLAALTTRATREGDEYVINGQKVFTSLAHFADYVWLAARTGELDPNRKHKGISILLVPTNAPGFSYQPTYTVAEVETTSTFYDNVRVPVSYRIGEEGKGWRVITSQLNRERLTMGNPGTAMLLFARTVAYAANHLGPDGKRIIDTPLAQLNFGRIYAGLEVLRLACQKQAWAIATNQLRAEDASAAKVYGAEFFSMAFRLMIEVLGQNSLIKRDEPGAILDGQLEILYRAAPVFGFAGGPNELQRDIIAQMGLGLPRARK